MIDLAALRMRTGLKADLRCTCGSNVFGSMPLFITNVDGRCVSSYTNEGVCSVYAVVCSCGVKYLVSRTPVEDQENTLIPWLSEEAKEFLAPAMPDFDAVEPEVHVEK